MIQQFRNWQAKRWLRKLDIKLSHGITTIPRHATLVLETGASVNVEKMHFSELRIGAMSYMRSGCELWNINEIGRFCSISNNVILGHERGGQGHPLHGVSTHPFQMAADVPPPRVGIRSARIGHDVWIGRDAIVMEGVTIGTGAVVATRSVVTHDVPAYAIVAGIPAKVIRFRHPPDLAAQLLESHWWEIHVDDLYQLPLGNPEQFINVIKNPRSADYLEARLTRNSWAAVKSDS